MKNLCVNSFISRRCLGWDNKSLFLLWRLLYRLLITFMHLLGIRQEKSPGTRRADRTVLSRSRLRRSFIILRCCLGSSRTRNRSKAYREPQLETKATTNITFMMIEFDLGGVSDRETKISKNSWVFPSPLVVFACFTGTGPRRKVRITKHFDAWYRWLAVGTV